MAPSKENIIASIKLYFADTSRSSEETREGLKDLLIEINDFLDALPEGGSSRGARVSESG
jgi:hypothetical protein